MTREDLEKLVKEGCNLELKQAEPLPLIKESVEPASFPIDSLPDILKNAILVIHKKTQAPISICAQSVLAAVNLATQAHGNIELPFGQVKPISCYFMSIAESGEKKTTCDNEVMSSIRDFEEKLSDSYKIEKSKWLREHEMWKYEKDSILKSKKKGYSREERARNLETLGNEPKPPLEPFIVFQDPTFSGLCRLMQNGYPSLGLFTSEGGQFVGGYSMKEDDKLSTATGISAIWDGQPITRLRSGDGACSIPGKRLSIHLMMQPQIANNFLADRNLHGQGFFSRFLIVAPKSSAGFRKFLEIDNVEANALESFHTRIGFIMSKKLPKKEGTENILNPKILKLTQNSKNLLITFMNESERRLAPEGKFAEIKEFANKLAEHACRIAAFIRLFEDIEADVVEEKYMKIGIELAEYYADEALRIKYAGWIDPNILLAEKLRDWLHAKWKKEIVSLPDIYQRSLNQIKTRAKAMQMVRILEDHGWLVKCGEAVLIDGKVRKYVWRVLKGGAG